MQTFVKELTIHKLRNFLEATRLQIAYEDLKLLNSKWNAIVSGAA